MTAEEVEQNLDIRLLSDASFDTTLASRFRHVLFYAPQTSVDRVSVEIANVFAKTNRLSIEDNGNVDRMTIDDSRYRHGAVTVAKSFSNNFESIVGYEDKNEYVQMVSILDTMNAVCFKVFLRQMAYLFGFRTVGDADTVLEPRLTNRMEDEFREYWNSIVRMIDQECPFLSGDEGIRTYRLEDHFERCFDKINDSGTVSFRYISSASGSVTTLTVDVVKNVVFHMMMPWLAFRFVACFIPGLSMTSGQGSDDRNDTGSIGSETVKQSQHNTGFETKRAAELAMYRMLADAIVLTKKTVQDDDYFIKGGELHSHPDGNIMNIFRKPGTHSLYVTKAEVTAKVLVIGGGGGGGAGSGGGGGGGGIAFAHSVKLPIGRHTVVVGEGGDGGVGGWTQVPVQRDGQESRFIISTTSNSTENTTDIRAKGGGKGGSVYFVLPNYDRRAVFPGSGGNSDDTSKGGRGGDSGTIQNYRYTYGKGGNSAGDMNVGKEHAEGGKGGDGIDVAIYNVRDFDYAGGGGSSGDTASKGGGGQGGGHRCSRGENGENGKGGGGGAVMSFLSCARAGKGGSGSVTIMYTGAPSHGHTLSDLERFGFAVIDTMNKKYISPEKTMMPSYRDKVTELSNETKAKSKSLYQTDAQLQQMKNNLHVMLHNSANVKALEKRSTITFWTMLALYLVMLTAVVLLFVFKYYEGIYTLTAISMAAVLLWQVVRATRGESMTRSKAEGYDSSS